MSFIKTLHFHLTINRAKPPTFTEYIDYYLNNCSLITVSNDQMITIEPETLYHLLILNMNHKNKITRESQLPGHQKNKQKSLIPCDVPRRSTVFPPSPFINLNIFELQRNKPNKRCFTLNLLIYYKCHKRANQAMIFRSSRVLLCDASW